MGNSSSSEGKKKAVDRNEKVSSSTQIATSIRNEAPVNGGVLQSYENKSAKKLLDAIKRDSSKHILIAIESAKVEFIKPTKKAANQAEYDEMVLGMMKYLTRKYDIGDGVLFTKTPLEYCAIMKSQLAKETLESEIEKYKAMESKLDSRDRGSDSMNARANLAKERLKAFQQTK